MRASAANDLLALYVSAWPFGKVFGATNCGRKSLNRAVLLSLTCRQSNGGVHAYSITDSPDNRGRLWRSGPGDWWLHAWRLPGFDCARIHRSAPGIVDRRCASL